MEDAHSVANSLTWGPDGWLYGCQGSTVTANVRGIEFQQGVWRYHPVSRRFELFCEGGGNSWGLDFDAAGNLFYSTNYGGYAMLHGVQGAYYWKQFGKHGALHNPYAYGFFDHVPHENLRGGHVTVGGVIYQGDAFPESFRGKYIAADLLGHGIYWHALTPRGSTFAARQEGDLLLANDTWFAPSDVTIGTDGALYVCDWSDQRTAHPGPGRVVGSHEWADLSHLSRRTRISFHLHSPKPLASGRATNWLTLSLETNEPLAQRRGGFWRSGGMRPLSSGCASWRGIRRACRPRLCGRWMPAAALTRGLQRSCSGIPAPRFALGRCGWWATARPCRRSWRIGWPLWRRRKRLSRCAANWPARPSDSLPSQARAIVAALVKHSEDAADPYIPLLLWWAVEQHATAAREAWLTLFTGAETWQLPLVHDTILPRLLRRYAAEGSEPGYLACATILEAAPDADRAMLLAALDEGLKDRGATHGGSAGTLFANLAPADTGATKSLAKAPATLPAQLQAQLDRAWRDDTVEIPLIRLMMRTGRPAAHARATALATDEASPLPLRREAIGLLAEVGQGTCVPTLIGLLGEQQPADIRAAALDALAAFDDPAIAPALVGAVRAGRCGAAGQDLRRAGWSQGFGCRAAGRGRCGRTGGQGRPGRSAAHDRAAPGCGARRAGEETLGEHSGRHARGTPGRDAPHQQRSSRRPRAPRSRQGIVHASTAALAIGCTARGTRWDRS